MALDETVRRAEIALNELVHVSNSSDSWSDDQRSQFDLERIAPLQEAGLRLLQALHKAGEDCIKAQKILG